ncbi:hypothetical protein Vadar_019964 [Vaccinium darrowii]|uniref:Uncharacterized protein n=1 Tax=Vaccinium darrowii TaxID=229202 RepID=A0ACB7Z5G6_9ERIC|nr:hypothetical protein Vadar_019964 [Vaccinium darrowii]
MFSALYKYPQHCLNSVTHSCNNLQPPPRPQPSPPPMPLPSSPSFHRKMTRAAALYSASLVAVCVSILVEPTSEFLFGPGLIGMGGTDCWASIRGAQGCGLQAVVSAFVQAQPNIVSPECCQAFLNADDKCWPKVFPLNPFFPPTLKGYCEKLDQEEKEKLAQEEEEKRDQEEKEKLAQEEEEDKRDQEEKERLAQEERDKRDEEERNREFQAKEDKNGRFRVKVVAAHDNDNDDDDDKDED